MTWPACTITHGRCGVRIIAVMCACVYQHVCVLCIIHVGVLVDVEGHSQSFNGEMINSKYTSDAVTR